MNRLHLSRPPAFKYFHYFMFLHSSVFLIRLSVFSITFHIFLISSCSLLPVPPIPVYLPIYNMTTFPVLLMSYTPFPFSSPNVCLLVP